jgi:hypothetical protein
MHPKMRHGSVWFDVSGFGRVRRDFVVDEPDVLAVNAEQFANDVARQIMLIDRTLPKREENCRPVKIDILGAGVRRVYELDTFKVVLEEPL